MLELRITEPGLSRYGLNRLYAGMHWTKRKSHADYWHNRIGWELKRIKAEMFESPVFIEFEFETGMDIDNCGYLIKLIIDGLKGIVIHDDSKKYVAGYSAVHGKEKGILIKIREIKNTSISEFEQALKDIRLYAGCSRCIHNKGKVNIECEFGGCNGGGNGKIKEDMWQWCGLRKKYEKV